LNILYNGTGILSDCANGEYELKGFDKSGEESFWYWERRTFISSQT